MYVAATKDLIRTRMYYNFGGIWEGLRKNAFAAHRFSISRMVLTAFAYLTCNLLPVAVLAYSGWEWLGARKSMTDGEQMALTLSAAQYSLSAALHLPMMVYLGIHSAYALLAPLGAILYAAICLDSMGRTVFGRGVSWKLREYGKPTVQPKG